MKNTPDYIKESENILALGIIEDLQRIAPDKFFIVGEQNSKETKDDNSKIKYKIDFDLKTGTLACFKNQWESIYEFLKNHYPVILSQIKNNLSIIDLGELRKGATKVLFGKELNNNSKLRLISGGSMNLITGKQKSKTNPTVQNKKHLLLTTRDGGNVDIAGLTGVAGRCETPKIDEESLKEFVEEGSFLGYVNGELNIVIPSIIGGEDEIEKFISRFIDNIKRNAINNSKSTIGFLSEKYRPEDEKIAKLFNKNFRDTIGNLTYSNLSERLLDALSHGRILFYKIKEDKSKYNSKVNIGGDTYEGYVFNDEANNTTEYRKVYDIDINKLRNIKGETISYPISYIGRLGRASTMFLESENQEPRTINISGSKTPRKIYDRLVPATRAFVDSILSNKTK